MLPFEKAYPWLGSILLLAGCRATPAVPAEVDWRVLGHSVEGRPIACASVGSGPTGVLILAGIHGDEAAGGPLALRLVRELEANPSWSAGRRVLVIPAANPDGLARGTRHNARGVDLNRNFPAANWRSGRVRGEEPLGEPESRALHELVLEARPALVLSFHQPLDLIDYDGPGAEIAELLAEVSPLAVRRLGGRPGSLGSWVGEDLGIPILTIELPRSADELDAEALWELHGPLLARAILLAERAREPVAPPSRE